jgi:hypothetical protein
MPPDRTPDRPTKSAKPNPARLRQNPMGKVTRICPAKPLLTDSSGRTPDAGIVRLGADDLEVLRDGRDIRLVKPSQIRAIQTEGSYTRLLFDANSSSMVKLSISHWESRLPEGLFFKASRSLLLNMPSILRLEAQGRNRTLLFLSGISDPVVLSRLESLRVRQEIQRIQHTRAPQVP